MEFLYAVWKYLLASAPYLLFGFLASGLVHQFISVRTIQKWLGREDFFSIVKAAIIGVPLPLCSCSVIPSAITLKKAGASNGATSAFLISTPESGIDSISMTYALMDLPMTILRPVAAFASALTAGTLQYFFNPSETKFTSVKDEKACCKKNEVAVGVVHDHAEHNHDHDHQHHAEHSHEKKGIVSTLIASVRYGLGDMINDTALWLTFGILAGALIEIMVPADFFMGLSGLEGRLAVMAVGIPLYICASATTPIAVSLMLKGMSPGMAIILLLTGPATNISNILVLQKYIGKKGIMLNLFAIGSVALVFSYIVDWLYSNYFVLKLKMPEHLHEHGADDWLSIASAVLLSILILKGLWVENIRPRLKSKKACPKCP